VRAITRGLLLVGHGSAHGPESAAPVHDHARTIRARGLFDDVQVAFYKQEPMLAGALERLWTDRVVIVPVFMAGGYYTGEVIPRALGLSATTGGFSPVSGKSLGRAETDALLHRQVRYTRPVGAHRGMAELVLKRASSAPLTASARRHTALIVVGHGTERSRSSSATVQQVMQRVRATSGYASVTFGLLDEEPRIDAVVDGTAARTMVIVPYFLASGWHTRHTIPALLWLNGAHTQRATRSIWYTEPVGTLPEIADVIIDLARAGAHS
jgi:sirohydrochlorin cobaltochelatase